MRTALDFSPLFRHSVGFDRLSRMMESALSLDENNTASYPPYNIEKRGENAYRISMAVAGFGENDLDITVKENNLIVSGKTNKTEEEKSSEFLYRGIAARSFERRFQVADHIKVTKADLDKGLLHI